MPREDTTRNIDLPYEPRPPPAPTAALVDLVRYVWEELRRVALTFAGADQPNSVTLVTDETLTPASSPVWTRLFDDGAIPQWINPSSAYDPDLGEYTIPQSGVWTVKAALRVPAFSAPGNRLYYAGVRMTITPAIGVPREIFIYDGTDDTIPLTVNGELLTPLNKGDRIYFDGTIVHPTVTTPTVVEALMSIIRMSGKGNNVTS